MQPTQSVQIRAAEAALVGKGLRASAPEARHPKSWGGPVDRGFVIFDAPCVYLGFSTWHDADRAAREAQGLLVTALACVRR